MLTREHYLAVWCTVAEQMPEDTPEHVIEQLRLAFNAEALEDIESVLVVELQPGVEPGTVAARFGVKPHVVRAFVRLAHELRHARDHQRIEIAPVTTPAFSRSRATAIAHRRDK